MNAALIFLLENDVLGIQSRPAHLQRLTVERRFGHLYSDLDVLAYWLRWRKLPAWSFASTPEQLAGHIGPLLHELPAEVRHRGEKHDHQSSASGGNTVDACFNETPPIAVQIEHWLLYGTWPAAVKVPRSAALTNWLESLRLSDWLVALRRCGAQQHAVQRLTSQLSPKFLLRITSVLAASHAEAVCDYVRAVQALGARLTIACSPPWTVHVSRYTLAHFLKLASSPSLKELASATLPALSLACQVSYERLLLSLRQETLGQQALQNLCDELDAEFDRCEVNRSLIPSGSQPFGLTPGTLARVRVLSESASDSEPGRDSRLPSSSGKAESFAASAASDSHMSGERLRLRAPAEYMESEGASSTKDVTPGSAFSALAQRRVDSVEDAQFSQPDGYKATASSDTVHGASAGKSPRIDVSRDRDGLRAARTETSSRIASPPVLPKEKLGLGPEAKSFHSQSAGTSERTELSPSAPLSAMAERNGELSGSNSYKASAKYEALTGTSADKGARMDVSEVSDGSRTIAPGERVPSECSSSISEPTMPPSKTLSLDREAKFSHPQHSNPTSLPFLSAQARNADASRSEHLISEKKVQSERTSLKEFSEATSLSAMPERKCELGYEPRLSQSDGDKEGASYEALSRTTGDKDSIVDGPDTSRRLQIATQPEHFSRISEPMMPPGEELGLASEAKFSLHNNSTTLSTRTEQHSKSENARAERVTSENHKQSEGAHEIANSSLDVSRAPNERLQSVREGHSSEPNHLKSKTTTHVERRAGNADSNRIPVTAFENSVESDGSSLSKRLNPGTAASPASQEQLKSLHESQLLRQSYQSTASRTVASSGKNKADEAQREQLEQLEHLEDLLRTGNLPQWSDALTPPARAWVGNLLHSHPGALIAMLRRVAGFAQSIARLVRYVPKPGLSEIIAAAAPEFGGLFILYIETGASLGGETRLSSAQRSSAAGVHWRETLGLILDQNTPIGNPARSLRALCSGVAQQLGLPADQYLEIMRQAAANRAATESKYAALVHVLSQVKTASPSPTWNSVSNAKTSAGGGSTPHNSSEIPASQQPTLDGDLSTESRVAVPEAEVTEGIRAAKELDFPHDQSVAGQLEYLLRYGELPPAAAAHSLAEFMENVVEPLIAHPEICRDQMRRAASSDLERKRIARLFSARALKLLWPLLLPSRHVHAGLALEDICAAATACARGVRSERVREICTEALLSTAVASAGHRWDVAAFFRSAIERLAKEQSLRQIELIEQLRRRLYCRTREIQENFGPALDRVERETAVIPIPMRASAAITIPGSRRPPLTRDPKPLPSGEPFYIGNAGAILLWPFLSRYFESLGLLEQGSFRGEKERTRAVYLVQYLASGTLDALEHELLLNKILCGVQPEQPLETVTPLTETEEALSAQLLHSLILNWEKLRNTSMDGLRQSFLLRDGRLLRRQSDGAWSLAVSTRAYDMLLDTLPWRLSMVRLPWMLTVLHVKWR
ncbi:MAG TPA: contractile injection system tape measure protein [Candidatus Angelobacter sp.]|nr:contractile injection system tape measure protein [Candidatus Angelobacter sp.]